LANCSSTQENLEKHQKSTSRSRNSYLWSLCYGKSLPIAQQKEGFIIKGRAENVETVFNQAKVLLAPIPFGAGIKGKLLESMQFGLPNVTSTVGAEAMHGNFDWNGFITDNETEFVEKAILLYQDENIWQKSQENGYLIVKIYSKKRFLKEISMQK
jgi:glycosyltransferase involved in cell wall biosynthesis